MKRIITALLSCAAFIVCAELDVSRVKLIGGTNKSALSYAPGEEMVFTVKADLNGQGAEGTRIQWTRSGDDGGTMEGSVPADQEAMVKTALAKPGFVRVDFALVDAQGKPLRARAAGDKKGKMVGFYAGAAVQPETLEDCGEPADFDSFWEKQKAKLAQVPFQGKVEQKEVRKLNGCTVYAVRIPCAGPRPVTGYLSVPDGAAPKSLPLYLHFAGYGTKIAIPPAKVSPDRLAFFVNAHGQELMQPKEYYKNFFQSIRSGGYGYAFDPEQNKDPETAFFNGMALRVLRALEYGKTRPEWDGKNLIVKGGSQGGLQTMWAAALDPDVTVAEPSIIWCCDLAGKTKKGRLRGEWGIQYVPALDYYDPVFMAKRVKKATVKITRAGLGDYVSPPSGLAICYKNLATPRKSIRWVQGSNHPFVPEKSEVILWETGK